MRRANRVLRNFFLSLAVSLGLVIFLGVAPASAHNSFDSSDPVNGSTLDVAPATWSLMFKKEVPLASASAELVGSDGVRIALAPPTYGATTNAIVFSLPPNLTGVNTARWRLVGVDGHVISGRVAFTVNALTAPSEPLATVEGAPQSTQTTIQVPQLSVDDYFIEPVPELPRHVFRFINYGALLILIGLLFVELDIATGVLGLAVAKKTMRIASVLLATSAVLQMMIFSADLSSTSFLGSIGSLGAILETTPGSMLIMKSIIGCLIGLISFRRKIEQTIHQTSWLIPGLLFLYLITLAYTGHSRSQRWAIFGVPTDVAHTVAAGVWLGGLLVLLGIVNQNVSPLQAVQALRRFGSAAKISVITLVVTGSFQTLRLHDDPWSILTSSHGQLLVVKLLAFGGMLIYANFNRSSLEMRPTDGSHAVQIKRLVVRTSIIETLMGFAVVAVTAVLVSSSLGK
jgi:copper transport protein